jgi:hypothetical protein
MQDKNRFSVRNAVFSSYLKFWIMDKSKNQWLGQEMGSTFASVCSHVCQFSFKLFTLFIFYHFKSTNAYQWCGCNDAEVKGLMSAFPVCWCSFVTWRRIWECYQSSLAFPSLTTIIVKCHYLADTLNKGEGGFPSTHRCYRRFLLFI